MRSFLSTLCVFLGIFLGTLACEDRLPADAPEKLEKTVGQDLVFSLEHAKKVTTYRLGVPGQDEGETIGPFPIKRRIKTVSGQEIVYFKALFLNDKTYRFDRENKIAFLPQFALKFEGDGKEVVLFVSVASKQVGFQNEKQVVDLKMSKSQLRHLISLVE